MSRTKLTIIVLAGILIFVLLLIVIVRTVQRSPETILTDQPPEVIQQEAQPLRNITSIPRIPDEQGGGVDTQSAEIKLSKRSIQAIQNQLPYISYTTSPDGIDVEVVIPSQDMVSNDWTLLVNIFGPDYQIPDDDPEYEIMKRAFLTGVAEVLTFFDEQDIDRSEVLIQWGDRAIIGERSQKWLQE